METSMNVRAGRKSISLVRVPVHAAYRNPGCLLGEPELLLGAAIQHVGYQCGYMLSPLDL